MSLDEKVSQNGAKKATPSNAAKKPQRKSLPKLPSEESVPLEAKQLKSMDLNTDNYQESGSPAKQLQETGSIADNVQESIRARVTPDDQELDELSV
jgi:hypothetical protein